MNQLDLEIESHIMVFSGFQLRFRAFTALQAASCFLKVGRWLEMVSEDSQASISTDVLSPESASQESRLFGDGGCLCAEYMQLSCFPSVNGVLGQLLNSTDVVLGTHLQVIYSIGEDMGRRLQKLCHLM